MRTAFAAFVLLAACASPPPAQPAPNQEDTCGLARFRALIGQQASAIDRATLPPRSRVIGPSDAVTMDYSAERLNIITDAQGRVIDLRCF